MNKHFFFKRKFHIIGFSEAEFFKRSDAIFSRKLSSKKDFNSFIPAKNTVEKQNCAPITNNFEFL